MEDVHDTCLARLFQNSNTINVFGFLALSPMMILKKLIFLYCLFRFSYTSIVLKNKYSI